MCREIEHVAGSSWSSNANTNCAPALASIHQGRVHWIRSRSFLCRSCSPALCTHICLRGGQLVLLVNYSPALKEYSFTYCRSNLSVSCPSKWLGTIISDREGFFIFLFSSLCAGRSFVYSMCSTKRLSSAFCVDGLKLVTMAEAFWAASESRHPSAH